MNNFTSYGPISLFMLCVDKTSENILKFVLEWCTNNFKKLPPSSINTGVEMAIVQRMISFSLYIQINVTRNWLVVAIFIDIESVYDNVDLRTLYNKLK